MKEFNLTQSFSTIKEMLDSKDVAVFTEELQKGNIAEYAIISRIGNRYDLDGNKISGYVPNPYVTTVEEISIVETENKEQGENNTMKYAEIEALIDNEIAKAVAEVNARHEQELAELKEKYAVKLENAKEAVKAELIAKLNN